MEGYKSAAVARAELPDGIAVIADNRIAELAEMDNDSFGGSGTTIIACEDTGRTGYCMELAPHYCDVIIRRYVEKCGADEVEVERGGEVIELNDAAEAAGATL